MIYSQRSIKISIYRKGESKFQFENDQYHCHVCNVPDVSIFKILINLKLQGLNNAVFD